MIANEKETVRALKQAWKSGYEIVPNGETIAIYTGYWALETTVRELPLAVSQELVEHYGGIPVAPMFVQKGRSAQTMFGAEEISRKQDLEELQDNGKYMKRIPVTFRGKWDLFVTSEGEWMGIDREYLDILDRENDCNVLMTPAGMALFSMADERLTIAPGKFGVEDRVKLQKIAEMYMAQKVHLEEVPENLCLFEDMERE